MKLLLLASTVSQVFGTEPSNGGDCPNSQWEFVADAGGNYCQPKDVIVTCDARQMFVTFTDEHIYKALDKTRVDSTEAAAIVGMCLDLLTETAWDTTQHSISPVTLFCVQMSKNSGCSKSVTREIK